MLLKFEEDKEKYNPFKEFKTDEEKPSSMKVEVLEIEEETENTSMTVHESIFQKILGKIKMMFAK